MSAPTPTIDEEIAKILDEKNSEEGGNTYFDGIIDLLETEVAAKINDDEKNNLRIYIEKTAKLLDPKNPSESIEDKISKVSIALVACATESTAEFLEMIKNKIPSPTIEDAESSRPSSRGSKSSHDSTRY